jgi:hypothetical protein
MRHSEGLYRNADTILIFAVLASAAALPGPFDLAVGLSVLLGSIAWDRTSWTRPTAAFAWMCSRVWPSVIHDPYNVTDVLVLAVGLYFSLGAHAYTDAAMHVGVRRGAEILYAVLVLMPIHGPPHLLVSLAYCVTCACVHVVSSASTDHTLVVMRNCLWILCIKSPFVFVFPIMNNAWLVRKYLMKPPTAPVGTAAAATTISGSSSRPTPNSSSQRRSSAVVFTNRVVPISARVPPQYQRSGAISSSSTPIVPGRRPIEEDDAELAKHSGFDTDEV